jgi:hypothetical protein
MREQHRHGKEHHHARHDHDKRPRDTECVMTIGDGKNEYRQRYPDHDFGDRGQAWSAHATDHIGEGPPDPQCNPSEQKNLSDWGGASKVISEEEDDESVHNHHDGQRNEGARPDAQGHVSHSHGTLARGVTVSCYIGICDDPDALADEARQVGKGGGNHVEPEVSGSEHRPDQDLVERETVYRRH